MSGDPAPGDISDLQTLNRYTYVRNNPANMTDPNRLCSDFEDDSCEGGFSISLDLNDSSWESRNGPQPATYSPPNAGHDPNPFDGETNGILNGLQVPTLNLPGLILPGDSGCDFGTCGTGGSRFIGLDDAAELGLCAAQPEICGGVIATTVTAYLLHRYGIDAAAAHALRPIFQSKRHSTAQADAAWREIQRICGRVGVQLNDHHRDIWHDQEVTKQGLGGFEALVHAGVARFCPQAQQ